jgi:hypothetical protein
MMSSRGWIIASMLACGCLAMGCGAEAVGDAGPDSAADAGRDGSTDGPRAETAPNIEAGVDSVTSDSLAADTLPPDVLAPDTLSPDIGQPKVLGCGVETLAGGAKPGTYDGFRQLARFDNPVNIGALPGGDLLVSDFDNNRVRRITPAGVVTTVALLPRPFGLNVGPTGTVYVQTDRPSSGAATNEGALWTLDPQTGVTTLLLDKSGRARGFGVLPDGKLVLADLDRHTIVLFDPATKSKLVLAGLGGVAGFADGKAGQARFNFPYDILVESQTSVLVADMVNGRLRRVSVPDGVVTTFAGSGALGSTDGPLLSASFNQPKGLAFGPSGEIFVSESGGRVVRRIENGEVKTIAGTGVAGHKDDEDPLQAQFYAIEGITVGANQQYLYLADGNQGDGTGHHRVRRIGIPPCTPPSDGGVPDAGPEASAGDMGLDQGADVGVDTSAVDTGATDTAADIAADTGAADTGAADTGAADTSASDTSADMATSEGGASDGGSDKGSPDAGPAADQGAG